MKHSSKFKIHTIKTWQREDFFKLIVVFTVSDPFKVLMDGYGYSREYAHNTVITNLEGYNKDIKEGGLGLEYIRPALVLNEQLVRYNEKHNVYIYHEYIENREITQHLLQHLESFKKKEEKEQTPEDAEICDLLRAIRCIDTFWH